MIGETLSNRYKLLRELGAGGMAWVYLAEDLLEHSQVAVKVLYPQFNRDMAYVQRFVREAKLALQLDSDHIVRILDYGADRDLHYLVMENIHGQDLAALLRERGWLPWQEALQMAAQVALALEAANARGIVHRDIKPQNIMITRQGVVKMLDFGIARARAMPTLTQTGFVGSPHYISPEQAMGKEVDIRSDIYSLGVSLYETIAGRLPFDSSTPWSIISQHIAQEPPELQLPEGGLPEAVAKLVNRMLTKDPDDRHQTPGELLAAIESAIRGRVLERPDASDAKRSAALGEESVRQNAAHQLLLSSLYARGREAADAEEWPQAVNFFTQIIRVDAVYRDATDRLAHAGLQARLAALYREASQALRAGRWQEALDELGEIVSVDATFRDAGQLLEQARTSMAHAQEQERLDQLYAQSLSHCQEKEWQKAKECLGQLYDTHPTYRDIARLYPNIRRRAWWSNSLVGRMRRKLMNLVHRPKPAPEPETHILAAPDDSAKQRERHERDVSIQA